MKVHITIVMIQSNSAVAKLPVLSFLKMSVSYMVRVLVAFGSVALYLPYNVWSE